MHNSVQRFQKETVISINYNQLTIYIHMYMCRHRSNSDLSFVYVCNCMYLSSSFYIAFELHEQTWYRIKTSNAKLITNKKTVEEIRQKNIYIWEAARAAAAAAESI